MSTVTESNDRDSTITLADINDVKNRLREFAEQIPGCEGELIQRLIARADLRLSAKDFKFVDQADIDGMPSLKLLWEAVGYGDPDPWAKTVWSYSV